MPGLRDQRPIVVREQITSLEDELSAGVPDQIDRDNIDGDGEAEFSKPYLPAVKPDVQRPERCETAVLIAAKRPETILTGVRMRPV